MPMGGCLDTVGSATPGAVIRFIVGINLTDGVTVGTGVSPAVNLVCEINPRRSGGLLTRHMTSSALVECKLEASAE